MTSDLRRLSCLPVLAFLCSLTFPRSQPPPQDRPGGGTIRVRAGEVVVDVSVTDGGGKPVRGLTQADFEVYEDGVRQQIASFRSVSTAARAAGAAAPAREQEAATGAAKTVRPAPAFPRLVSIVFDKVNTERGDGPRAAAAARAYAEKVFTANDLAAVYGIGSGVHVFQTFTGDREMLLRSIQAATGANAAPPSDVAAELRTALQNIPNGVIPGVTSDADKMALAYSGVSAGDSEIMQKLAPLLNDLRILLVFREFDRQIRSDRSLAGLLAIINSQKVIPARKCLIFVSSGFTLPPGGEKFRAVVNAANRAGVTIYSVDASGLRTTDPNEERQLAIDAALKTRSMVGPRSSLGLLDAASGLNPLDNLERLAEGTGGYAVHNTNDLAEGVERLGTVFGEYYVLTYTPANLIPDGKFRNTSVKVGRGGLTVRARNGYYAFPDTDRLPLLGYEAELLEDLNAKEPPGRFPVYAGGFSFPARGDTPAAALFVQFPLAELKVEKRPDTRSYTVQADVLLLLRGMDGAVLHRMSRQYDMEGSLEMLESTMKKSFSFCRRIPLPPGAYALEAAVRDRRTAKVSVRKAAFQVDALPAEGLRLSSIVLCKEPALAARLDAQDASIGPPLDDPLRAEGAPVSPDLSGVFRMSSERQLCVYFVARPRDASAPVRAAFEFLRAGAPALRFEPALPPADENGEIRHLAQFELGRFKPGRYELRVTLSGGAESATSAASFRIEK